MPTSRVPRLLSLLFEIADYTLRCVVRQHVATFTRNRFVNVSDASRGAFKAHEHRKRYGITVVNAHARFIACAG